MIEIPSIDELSIILGEEVTNTGKHWSNKEYFAYTVAYAGTLRHGMSFNKLKEKKKKMYKIEDEKDTK